MSSSNKYDIAVGVIGGSGLYKLENLTVVDHVNPETVSPQALWASAGPVS